MEFKGSKKNWHVVEFAGHYHFMDEPYYTAKDLMDEDDYKDMAKHNAQLACAAPDLLKACESAILELQIIPCKCDPKVIDLLEAAINKALHP